MKTPDSTPLGAIPVGTLNTVLGLLKVAPTETNQQQLQVLVDALRVFASRNELRGDLWSEFDLGDAGHNVRLKGQRLRSLSERGAYQEGEALDDAYDAINYSAFAARHILELYPRDTNVVRPADVVWRIEDEQRVIPDPAPRPLEAPEACRRPGCAHPWSWHNSRVAGMSQREVAERGFPGNCTDMSCRCTEFVR